MVPFCILSLHECRLAPSPADAEGGSNELEKTHKDLLWWQLLSNINCRLDHVKTEISAETPVLPLLSFISTSATSSSSSLTVAGYSLGYEMELRPLGSLAFTTEPVELYGGSLIKKSLKTKPKKSRPTTCKRNLSGLFKSSSCQQQSRHHSLALVLFPWQGDVTLSVAGVGQVLLITKELLLEKHS